MGSLSDYVELEVLDHVLKTADWAQPAALYIGLSTADPTDDGSITLPKHRLRNCSVG